MLGLQRSAGNRATASFVTQSPESALQLSADGGSQTMVQRSIGSWFKKKFGKQEDGSGISGPTGGHTMTDEEQGGVPSMKQLIEQHEKSQNGSVNTPPPVEDKPKETVESVLEETHEPPKSIEDQAKEDDEKLFDDIKKTAAILRDPTKTKKDDQGALDTMYQAVESAIALWMKSPRRLAGAPEDRAKKLEIEALRQNLRWNVDAAKVNAAATLPNPELKPGDKDGYFISKTVSVFKILPDGSLDASGLSYPDDRTFDPLPALTVGGKEGYTIQGSSSKYWVAKSDVVVKHGKFDKVGGNLFAKDPTPDDVKQTTLGDCYLQASIASIASQNPGLIREMLRDNGDDTVTVRLYKVDDTDSKNHKFDPQYFRVEKSVPKDSAGQEVYNAGAIWVRMLEKAYASGGFTGRTNKAAPATLSYEGIAAGQSRHALEVLTGKPSSVIKLEEGPQRYGTDNYWQGSGATGDIQGSTVTNAYTGVDIPWSGAEMTNYDTAKAADNYANLLSFKILKDKAKVDTWATFVKTDAIKNMFAARDTDRATFAAQITMADFDAAFKTGALDGAVASAMLGWIESQKLYPGALGSGKYSQTQLDTFAKIKERLDAGGEVTAATQDKPDKGVTGVGASGGEAVAKGMVGSHVYTILAYRANATNDPAGAGAGDFYWLKIRNPWGNYGRKYDFSKGADAGEEVKGGDGVSWLELSDLTKFFYQVHFN